MNNYTKLKNLQKRNNSLKSKLLHEQLKHNNYTFQNYKKCSLQIINEYKQNKSLIKSSLNLKINPKKVLNWYIQGHEKNSIFREFYLTINQLNNESEVEHSSEDYMISEYGDGWSYKTFINGEKVFIISNDLNTLKDKVKSRNLPIN